MAVNLNKPPGVDGWLARLGQALCPPRCPICRESGLERDGLCRACAAGLPWNRRACRRCAVPLPLPGQSPAAGPAGAGGAGPAGLLPPRLPDTALPGPLCGACLARPPPLDEVHGVFVYGFPLDRLLPRFKFHHDLATGRLLAHWMAEALAAAPRPDALLALPLHRARLRNRGYDQALELARPLARAFDLPLLEGALRRHRATSPQSRLDAAARHRNLRGAFVVRPGTALPAHIALVDDVMTTGATLHAAAVALRRAGATRVDAWVCARVP